MFRKMGFAACLTWLVSGLAGSAWAQNTLPSVPLDPATVESLRLALAAQNPILLQRIPVPPDPNEVASEINVIREPQSVSVATSSANTSTTRSPSLALVSQLQQLDAAAIWRSHCLAQALPATVVVGNQLEPTTVVPTKSENDPYCSNAPGGGSPFAEVDTTYGVWTGLAALRRAEMSFAAEDISVGSDSAIWFLDARSTSKDKPVKRVTASGIIGCGSAAGIRIAAGPKETVFVLNSYGQLWMGTCNQSGANWTHLSDSVMAVAVNPSGQVWGLGKGGEPMAFDMSTKEWKRFSGEGIDIGVGIDGRPWVVNEGSAIWLHDSDWKNIPGTATQVTFDADGFAYIVGVGNQVYRSKVTALARDSRQTWLPMPGVTGWRVAVAPNGSVYSINQSTKKVMKFDFVAP